MKNFWTKLILILIISSAFILMIASALKDTQTTDEAIHQFAGYTYLKERDFRLDPEHPPLLKEISALPLLLSQNIHYSLDNSWTKAGNFYYDSWKETRVLGEKFFYLSQNNPDQMLFWGRMPFIVLTLILGLFVYFWAKKLYGRKAGIFALILTLFYPNILAHGRLINTDLGLALFVLLSVYFWGEFLKFLKFKNLLLTGIFAGLALASKFTAVILLPIFVVLLAIKLIIDKGQSFKKYLVGLLVVLISIFVVVWFSYGFSDKSFYFFPANFLKGLYLVFRHAYVGHSSFLLGQTSSTGWWYYFPVAIFFKTPIPVFVFLALAIIFWKKLRAKNLFDEVLIIIPPMIFLLFSLFSKANLGIRHILPILPFLFILASRSINLVNFSKEKVKAVIFAILILWYLSSAIISFPNYLAYFNEFAGGPKSGYRILTDSNLDWGQDILRLKDYLEKNHIQKVYLVYPWDGDEVLRHYGINFTPLLPTDTDVKGPVVISATYLQTDAYSWLKKYPFEQITPGLFLFKFN